MNQNTNKNFDDEWLQVMGRDDRGLAAELTARINSKIAAGKFKPEDLNFLSKAELRLIKKNHDFGDDALERLRRLCQLWELDLRPAPISSHRRFVGPLIVGAKRMIFPILRVFMKETIKQQREFNAEVIHMLADLGSRSRRPD
jgi:hypothetical protein